MKTRQSSHGIIFVPLVVAVAIAFSSTALWEDESVIDTSIFFHRPIYLLPDDAIIEAYRLMGYEQSRSSQAIFSELFNSMLPESDTPVFAYLASQVVRNATLLSKATNNSNLLRLYAVLLKDKETMQRYHALTRNFLQYRAWVHTKGKPPPRMERMIKDDIRESDRLGLRPWSGQLVEMLADYYFSLRKDELAFRSLEDALAREIEGEHISAASHTAGRIGIYHLEKGDLAEAERSMLQSLHYAQLSGDHYYLARSLSFLAQLRAAQGNFADAESLIVQSIEHSKETKNLKDEVMRITTLAELEVSFGEYSHAEAIIEKAMLMAEKSLQEAPTSGNPLSRNALAHYQAQCLMLQGTIQLAQKDYSTSITTIERALQTCQGTIDRSFEANLKKKLGDAYAESGRSSEAMQCYEEALGAERRLHEKEKEAECLTAIGALHVGRGEYRQAEGILKRAIEVEGQNSWMQKIQTLDILARTEAGLGEYAAARNLLEESISILERELAERRFVENRYALSGQLRETLADLLALEGEHFYNAESLIAAAEEARQLRIGERGIQCTDLGARIRRCLAERNWIPENAVIIQHLLIPDGVIIAAMDRYGETYRVVPIAPDKLEADVSAFIDACLASSRTEDAPGCPATYDAIEEKARALYGVLLEPITALISCKDVLCFIPDDPLRRLPFGALIPPGRSPRFLIETKRIIASSNLLAASSRATGTLQRNGGFSSPLIVCRPEISPGIRIRYPALAALPHAESEIIEISNLIDHCEILTGPRATKKAVLAGLGKADHIHIAAHRIPYPAESGASALLLADCSSGENEALESSLITEREIRKLDLSRAKLVFLSTCESAACEKNTKTETLGLAGAFLDAGARSVVATIWPIEDKEAGEFVAAFYREMIQGKASPQEALQIVQKYVIQMNRSNGNAMANIRYWAPYLLLGSF